MDSQAAAERPEDENSGVKLQLDYLTFMGTTVLQFPLASKL